MITAKWWKRIHRWAARWLVLLSAAVLVAETRAESGNGTSLSSGPYAELTPKEQAEAGLVGVVDTGTLRAPALWNYKVEEGGDYQLGMAWVDILTPGTVSVSVSVNGNVVHTVVAKRDNGPTRLETRLEDLPEKSSITIRAEADTGVEYRMAFHLLSATPVFHGIRKFRVADYGAMADGLHDDMDAIHRALAAARKAGGGIVRFERGKTYRVIGRKDLHKEVVFDLEGAANIKIEGNGATLILHPPDGLANIRKARNIHIDGLSIDYQPKPYFQGRIEDIDLEAMRVDLRVPARYPVPDLGKPNGPAPFFGRSFIPDHLAARSGSGENLYIESIDRIENDVRRLRLQIRRNAAGSHTPDAGMKNRLRNAKDSGATEFVVPHLRYGHLHGQTIINESARVRLSNLRWSMVPYFWLTITDNVGPVSFFNVDLQMKNPETELYASWRDGFHIKNGRFGVMIDGSDMDGAAMYDDTFAIYSRVHRVVSSDGDRMTLKPGFTNQKDLKTWLPGDWVSVWSKDQSELHGMGRLKSVTDVRGENRFVVELESVPKNLRPGDTVINEEVLNRGTVIRNCRTSQVGTEYTSTRFRASNITFESNHFEDFRFNVEFDAFWGTPRSRNVLVRDSYIGGGQSDVGLRWPIAPRFERCKLEGTALRFMGQVEQAVLDGVEWIDAPEVFLEVGKGSSVKIAEGCTVDGKPVSLEDASIRQRIKGSGKVTSQKRIQPGAGDDFMFLGQGMDAIPDPMLRPSSLESLGSGAEWTTPFPGFSWTEHPKAFSEVGEPVEYEIQIATDSDFETLVDKDRVSLNRYVHDAPFPPGQYHWRVRAIPYGEDPTNWSAPQDFTIREADLVVTVDVSGNPVRGVREAVAKAKAAKGQSVRIVMPAGEYAIDRTLHGYLFDLNGCSDIVVDGTGVTLNFSSRKQGLIRSRDSERIAVTGFDVSYATGALRVQGRVTALDPANRRVSVQVEPGYPGFDASDKPKDDIFYLLEPGTQGRLKSDTRNFFRTNDPFKKHGDGAWSFTITSDFEKWGVGDRFAYNFRAGSMHLVDFSESREVTAHGLTAGGWGGMQFVSVEGDDFRILNCTTRFDPGKWMTGNADGVHIRGHRLGPWIEGLSITAIGDDAIALYDRPSSIRTARVEGDPKTAYLRPEYFNLEVGDEVSFFQPTEGRILLETQVTSVKPRNDGYVLVSFADDLPEPVKTSGKLVEQTQIWNRSKSCGNFMVRGGEFINIRRYGTVFRSRRGVVENNTYVGNSARAIVFINGTQWPNGLYASEIIVRNNTIADSSFEPSRAAPIAFIFNGYKRAAASIGPRNILIEGNTIEGCPSPEIALHWVRNAVVRANSVKQRDGTTPARLEVRNSEDIVQKTRKEYDNR